ncbi:hypothetical protein NBRC116493_07280 [Aurantivibrio infirmus]
MSVVKGSKQHRLIVVPYRPQFRILLIASIVLALCVVAAVSYLLGEHRGSSLQIQAVAERDSLRLKLESKTKEAEQLSQQVANLTLATEVDKVAGEDVRNEVIQLKDEISALQEDISFYRGLMEPTDNKRGLTIGSVDVISTSVPRQYDFKVVVQQLTTNHQLLQGSLEFNVIGREGPIYRNIALKDLTSQVDSDEIRLGFKYFQNIEGRLEIPIGFEPERIEIIARSTGRDAVQVEKKFGWLVQEKLSTSAL